MEPQPNGRRWSTCTGTSDYRYCSGTVAGVVTSMITVAGVVAGMVLSIITIIVTVIVMYMVVRFMGMASSAFMVKRQVVIVAASVMPTVTYGHRHVCSYGSWHG